MTFVRDGEPFNLVVGDEPGGGLVAVGWLDASESFNQGPVPPAFVERLRRICREQTVNRSRGWHRCNLCPRDISPGLPRPTTVASPEGEFTVGGAEIRISGPSGKGYAAPDMVIHYVEQHSYQPPSDFVAGVVGDASG